MTGDPLVEYRSKRRLGQTPEPAGKPSRKRAKALSFVVQRHQARSLHYDSCLELDGALKSWAVPKGPSTNVGEKRLAVEVEDHPLEYGTFEGTIPKGHYGAGTVEIWDHGTWTPLSEPHQGLAEGKLSFDLHGEQLEGRFALVRMRTKERKPTWLLVKEREDSPDKPAKDVHRERPVPVAAAKSSPSSVAVLGVMITHPTRVMDRPSGVTKLDLARYHEAIADLLLPYAARRPLALVRCPDGADGEAFFQKQRTAGMPDEIKQIEVAGQPAVYVDGARGLVSLAQFSAVELHGWGASLPDPQRPDVLVLDLDPDEDLPFSRVTDAARAMKELFDALGLESFVKTTGGKGLHVVVPLEPEADFDFVKDFAHAIALRFAHDEPGLYTAVMSKRARREKIFIDYLRNGLGATAILPYSPRARPGATVATPISWRDLAHVNPAELTVRTVPKLVARRKDPWAKYHTTKQRLPRPTKAAQRS